MLHSAVRAVHLYPGENRAVRNAIAELGEAAERVVQCDGEAELRLVADLCFLDDVRLRIDPVSHAAFAGVAEVMRRHGIGRFRIAAAATAEEWIAAIRLLGDEPTAEDRFGAIAERWASAGIQRLGIAPMSEHELLRRQADTPIDAARRTYRHSVAAARQAMESVRMGRGGGLRGVKRAVQSIVDQVLNNETSILGMTVLRDHDEYTFRHSVNVCIFSIALGKKLGFDRAQLYDLGTGALLHDIGKLRMPTEVINKTGPLTAEEWTIIREHPTEGLLTLLEMRAEASLPLRTALLTYEHHMRSDGTGYPSSFRPRASYLFSRIVAIADSFDAATSRRAYQDEPRLPDVVLREMRDEPRFGHDPLLVKAFVSMLGVYPAGSLVVLDTYELAVVVARNPRPECVHLPIVQVIFDSMGLPLEPPVTVDLAATDPATGAPLRTIIKTTDPEPYGIDVRRYFA